jgi:hypothetical protein
MSQASKQQQTDAKQIFHPEEGSSMFLHDVGEILSDYTASHPSR